MFFRRNCNTTSVRPGLRGDALAYATLEHIRRHPRQWDQAVVVSGGRACFIGRALLLSRGTVPGYSLEVIATAGSLLGWDLEQVYSVYGSQPRDYAALEWQVLAIIQAGNIGRTTKKRDYQDPFAEPAPEQQPLPEAVPEQAPEPVPA